MVVLKNGGGQTAVQSCSVGFKDAASVQAELMHGMDQATTANGEAQKVQNEADARTRLRDEQDAAYQASLQQDREKEAAREAEQQKEAAAQRVLDAAARTAVREEQQAADATARAEQLVVDNAAAATGRVPVEPAPEESAALTISFRTRDGRKARRFMPEDTVQCLVDYAHGEGYPPSGWNLSTQRPRRLLDQPTWHLTLAEFRLAKREMIQIEEI
jgi:FAS-associated factor 2